MINIAKLLKDAPRGMKLYSPLFGECKLGHIELGHIEDEMFIHVSTNYTDDFEFDEFGQIASLPIGDNANGECLLFPSKDCRTWEGWKLPVEPKFKFKVGDWIVRGRGFVYEPSLITEIRDYYVCELLNGERVTYALNDVHKNFHLWTIADAKDGDVICTANSNLFIYKCKGIGVQIYDYCGLYHGKFEPDSSSPNGVYNSCDAYVPATKEERGLFFAKMKEEGYEWDADKKELRKIQPHYDIANFYAGMPVLVRDYNNSQWSYVQFSHLIAERNVGEGGFKFNACGIPYIQCIPYNDDTKHLLGTTNPCDERFINW